MKPKKNHKPSKSTTVLNDTVKPSQPFLSAEVLTKILWGFFAVYVIMVAYGIMYHELWRDEGADWMAVRDLGLIDLFSWYVPQGGHPPLYYVILFPFAKLGFPLKMVNFISLVFMSASVYVIFFKTKFPFYFKLALVFSFFFLHEYSVIGRNYGVVVFFTVLTVYFYQRRFEKPWQYALILICLLNSDSLMFPFTMAIVFLYWVELWQQNKINKDYILPALSMTIGGLYIIPYLAISGISSQSHISKIVNHFAEINKTISGAFILYNDSFIIILVFIVLLVLLASRQKALFILICGTVGILYLLAYVRLGDMRHRGLLLLEIIASYGIALAYTDEKGESLKSLVDDGKKKIEYGLIIITCFLVYQSYIGLQVWKQDVDENFSGSKDAADFILQNHLEHKIIIGQPSWAASAVEQYLPSNCKMYYADCQRYGTFIIYDSLYEANQFRFASNYAHYIAIHNFPDSLNNVLLLVNSPMTNKKFAEHWNIIYMTTDEPMKKQESYFIYQFKK